MPGLTSKSGIGDWYFPENCVSWQVLYPSSFRWFRGRCRADSPLRTIRTCTKSCIRSDCGWRWMFALGRRAGSGLRLQQLDICPISSSEYRFADVNKRFVSGSFMNNICEWRSLYYCTLSADIIAGLIFISYEMIIYSFCRSPTRISRLRT